MSGGVREVVLELSGGLREVGAMDEATFSEIRLLCILRPEKCDAKDIKALRDQLNVSRSILANVLNVKENTVARWEQGRSRPRGPALRLLEILKKRGLEPFFEEYETRTAEGGLSEAS